MLSQLVLQGFLPRSVVNGNRLGPGNPAPMLRRCRGSAMRLIVAQGDGGVDAEGAGGWRQRR
jgi:hypothetical protein